MSLPVLAAEDLADLQPPGLDRSTPLWFYVLREADVVERGLRRGPVGARIVAEVLIGLLEGDPESFVSQEPDWLPSPPTFVGADERRSRAMTDLPHFAGVHA